MNICGIISEYNPFHNGHLYQIKKTREILGDCLIICIMSGNYVQRGEPALFEKYDRAKTAILSGADIVIELPLIYALSSAEYFAKGAVKMLSKLSEVTHLSFGSECGDIELLKDSATALLDEKIFDDINDILKTGVSYAKAREIALLNVSERFSNVISSPNNILAVEYIKAIMSQNSNITPLTIKREGTDHDTNTFSENFTSASNIRRILIEHSFENVKNFIPLHTYETLLSHDMVTISNMEHNILSHLRRLSKEDFLNIIDVSEGLHNRLYRKICESSSLSDIYNSTKTKRYPESRIRRIILHAYLGIRKDMYDYDINYARVLGLSSHGRQLLKKMATHIDFITKPSSYSPTNKQSIELLKFDNLATDLYNLATNNVSLYRAGGELRGKPFVL